MKPLLIATVALGSAAVGFGVGYKLAEKKLSAEFDERLERETEGMREFYQAAKKPFATPQEAVAELIKEEPVEPTAATANTKVAYHKIVKSEKYVPEEDPEEEHAIEAEVFEGGEIHAPPVPVNLFSNDPVIISQEEFMGNETEYLQGVLTYYQVDGVLTDEREDVIEDVDATVGDKNLGSFGNPRNGSSDPNVIHVRNPRLQMEFEVCLDQGSYREKVLGIEQDPPALPSGRSRP